MKNAKLFSFIAVIIAIGAAATFFMKKSRNEPASQPIAPANKKLTTNLNNMKITSSAFENNANIPPKYTCDGENISPALQFSDVPMGAQSLAFILHDPDAPVAGGFTHWVIFNIDPATKEITENNAPTNAIQGQNSAGQAKYTSPCPPSGTHHYEFRIYALDEKLNLDSSAKKADVEKAMEGHILDETSLVGLYQRL